MVDGTVRVSAKYAIDKNRSDALIEVKDAVDRIRPQLPAQLDSPRVSAPMAFDDPVVARLVVLPDGRSLRLDQIAAVRDMDADRSQTALLDGRPVVGFNVYRAFGQDELALDKRLHQHRRRASSGELAEDDLGRDRIVAHRTGAHRRHHTCADHCRRWRWRSRRSRRRSSRWSDHRADSA